jgi:hypothetical protein
MNVTLDGKNLFDRQQLEIEKQSFVRDTAERTIAGLDGILSIDLGGRGRRIKQTGSLSAKSRLQLNEKISAISAFMDGNIHTLKTGSGEELENLRMDSFTVKNERTSGTGIVVDYEIIYTQLKAQI